MREIGLATKLRRERKNEASNCVDDKLLSETRIDRTLAFTEWFLSSIERQWRWQRATITNRSIPLRRAWHRNMWCRNPLIFSSSPSSSDASDASYSRRTLKLVCSWPKVISSQTIACRRRRRCCLLHTVSFHIIIVVVGLKIIIGILLNKQSGAYPFMEMLKIDWRHTHNREREREQKRREYRICICYESKLQ